MAELQNKDNWISARRFGEKFGLTKATIITRIHKGEIDFVKVDGRYLIPEREIKRFVVKKRGQKQ